MESKRNVQEILCKMQTIITRIILNEESHDLQLSAPTVFAALREHKEFFVYFREKH